MKRFILSALVVLLCLPSFGQRIQFSDPTNVWSLVDSTIGCCIPRPVAYTKAYYDSTGTVTYHGHSYQSLVTPVQSVLVREDSNKVYVIGTSDSTERVLYDFTLHLHDTMRLWYPQDVFTTWVTNIDSTEIAGNWYKVWSFQGIDQVLFFPDSTRNLNYAVIEGIGCTNGAYYPASPYYMALFDEHLLCFSNNVMSGTPLSSPVASYGYGYIAAYFDNDSSCSQWHVITPDTIYGAGVPQLNIQPNKAIVAPNPINETSKIILPYSIASGTLTIINAVGQEVLHTSFVNEEDLPIGDKISARGVYFYSVTNCATGEAITGNFVHQ